MQKPQEKLSMQQRYANLQGPVATVFTAAQTGMWRLERPVVDAEKCRKCGICKQYCPADVISPGEEEMFDLLYCKGCGICSNVCPFNCIKMCSESEVSSNV